MPDEFFDRPLPTAARRPARSLRGLLGGLLLAFIGGGALVGYLAWDGRITLDGDLLTDRPTAAANPSASLAALPSPNGEVPAPQPSAEASDAMAAVSPAEQRVTALEQRLARIDLQAAAAEGQSARAEALLVAFASRRAIDRGAPLDYLADQLKSRFGNAQPNAVATLIEAARQPVTLDQLAGQLDALEPVLTQAPAQESGWARIKRELSGLFVVRRGDTPAPRPESRLERARLLLRTGQFDAAIKEVQGLPGAAGAGAWLSAAQRYAMAQRALDVIESTALLDPARPAAAASPSASPSADPSALPSGAI